MATRLLLLEDDDAVRTSLRLALIDEGYEIVEAADAQQALGAAAVRPFDVMLVDLMLGGMDGLSFIQRVRPRCDTPIVVVSAREGTNEIVSALEAGADDYVTKPFVVDEIKARIRTMLRRPQLADSGEASRSDGLTLDADHGPLVLYRDAGVARRGADDIHLTSTEFRLLCVLADDAGVVLSRQDLLARVWDQGFFGDERIVDVHIGRLRNKIERDPAEPSLIVTLRGLGYRLDLQ